MREAGVAGVRDLSLPNNQPLERARGWLWRWDCVSEDNPGNIIRMTCDAFLCSFFELFLTELSSGAFESVQDSLLSRQQCNPKVGKLLSFSQWRMR